MVYYKKIVKTTSYGNRSLYAYIIEENKDDKTRYLTDKLLEYIKEVYRLDI